MLPNIPPAIFLDPMKLNARLIVFFLMTVFQAAVIFLLSAFGDFYIKSKLSVIGTDQLQVNNIGTVKQVGSILNHLQLRTLRIGTQQWQLVQDLIEHAEFGEHGEVSIVDSKTGRPVCHPRFKDEPELANKASEAWLYLSSQGDVIEFHEGDSVKTGACELDGRSYRLAAQTIGRGEYAVVVQRESGERLKELVADAAFPITKLLVGICVIGLFFSTLCGLFIIWWTERKLSDAQEEIEQLSSRPVQSKAFVDMDNESAVRSS